MGTLPKQHLILDEDLTQYLQDFTSRAGFPSITFSAHFLLRMIRSAEVTSTLELKNNIPMPTPPAGQAPIVFKRKLRMKIKR
jgi:hypothetical protein